MSETRRERPAVDAAIAFAIRVLSAGLVFGLQVLLARLMPLSDYGGFVTVWTWMLAIGSFGALGLAEAGVRFVPRYAARGRGGHAAAYFRFGLVAAAMASVALGALGLVVATMLPEGPRLVVALVALGLPFLAIEYVLEGVARGLGWFRLTTVPVYIVRPLLIAGIVVGLDAAGVALSLSVVGAVVIGVMATISAVMAAVLFVRIGPSSGATRAAWGLWLRASLPLLLVAGLQDLVAYVDVLLLSMVLPAEEVAIYFAAARVLALAHFVAYAFTLVSGRRFALDLVAKDRHRLQQSVLETTRMTFWFTVLAVAATLVAGPYLLMAFGPGFAAGQPVLVVLGVGVLFRALGGQGGELLLVTGRQREAVLVFGTTLAAAVILIVLLAPAYGLIGAAAGWSGAMAVQSAALAWAVSRTQRLRIVSVGFPRLSLART